MSDNSKIYDIGTLRVMARLPISFLTIPPYDQFVTDGEASEGSCDAVVDFELCETLPEAVGELMWEDSHMRYVRAADGLWRYSRVTLSEERKFYEYAAVFYPDNSKYCRGWMLECEAPRIKNNFTYRALGFDHLFATQGGVELHASYINYEGRAILFTAPSGTGKTTQANIWRKYMGAEIVNGDKVLIMRTDRYCAFGLPISGSSGECLNRTLPIRAIVALGQAKENMVRRIRGASAFSVLFSGSFFPIWNKQDADAVTRSMSEISAGIPMFRLDCLPNSGAAEALLDEIIREEGDNGRR